MGAGCGVWLQQVTEDSVRDEVECVSGYVPQDHGPGPPVQALEALSLEDAADAVDGPPVVPLAGDIDGAQWDVGAVRHVAGEVQVLCARAIKRWGGVNVLDLTLCLCRGRNCSLTHIQAHGDHNSWGALIIKGHVQNCWLTHSKLPASK